MTVSRFTLARKVPKKATTEKSSPATMNYSKGMITYKPNDAMDYEEASMVNNARFSRIGEYITRPGLQELTEPIGKRQASSTLSENYELAPASQVEFRVSKESNMNPIYSITAKVVRIYLDKGSDVVEAKLYDNQGKYISSTCVHGKDYNNFDTLQTVEFKFAHGEISANGTYTIRINDQDPQQEDTYYIAVSTITGEPLQAVSTAYKGNIVSIFEANGDTFNDILFAFRYIDNEATPADPDHHTAIYRYNSGEPVLIRVVNPYGDNYKDVTEVRWAQSQDEVRYTTGIEGPHKITPVNDWEDTAIQTIDLETDVNLGIKTSNILFGTQDNLIYFDADVNTQAVWTYNRLYAFAPPANYQCETTFAAYVPGETTTTIVSSSNLTPVSDDKLVADIAEGDIVLDDMGHYGSVYDIVGQNITIESISHNALPIDSYDKFDRDFQANFPTIKSGDPLTAMFVLGGVIYFLTRRNKYYLYIQNIDVFTIQTSSAQHGTFSQESTVCDLNYAYYACDDGIYIFDGSSEASLTKDKIQNAYDKIPTEYKEKIRLELYNNRLYVFIPNAKTNTEYGVDYSYSDCWVYNINLKLWESFDTGVCVSATLGRQSASNRFICGSSCFGQLMSWGSTQVGMEYPWMYADAGKPIEFDLKTAYMHFGTPSQLHRITKWRPEFTTSTSPYTIKCGYSVDFQNTVKYVFSIDLYKQRPVYESYEWDKTPEYGIAPRQTMLTTIPKVYGEFRRAQICYQHHAAFQPVEFKAHTLTVQTQRIR